MVVVGLVGLAAAGWWGEEHPAVNRAAATMAAALDDRFRTLPYLSRNGISSRTRVGARRTSYDAVMTLKVGEKAPDFALHDQTDKVLRLKDYKGRRVLVYFYPKADTPGCTAQSCGLRDILGDIGDTAVIGISPDKPAKQAKFDQKYGLGFPLLADEDHAVAEAYGVWTEKSMYGKKYMGILRSAFLVDEKGKLAEVWYKVSPADTPKNLLAALAG